jgi:hypothetical protein
MSRWGWLALLFGAFLLAGCDVTGSSNSKGPPPKTLSHAQFVHAGNRVCARFLHRVQRVDTHTAFPKLESLERKVIIPAEEHVIVVLRRLAPPPRDAAAFQRVLTTFDQVDIDIHRLLDAADARQVRRVKDLAKRLDILTKQLDARFAKAGLRTCAKG